MSAAPPGHEWMSTFWVVVKAKGKKHCQVVYGRGKKSVRKAVKEKLKDTAWELQSVTAITLPEYSSLWYDEEEEQYPSEELNASIESH